MSLYYVSTDETLGRKIQASTPEDAARELAPELEVNAGATLHVRWDVRLHPHDPSVWLFASLREVSVEAAWLPAGAEAPAKAPAEEEPPAAEAKAPAAEAKEEAPVVEAPAEEAPAEEPPAKPKTPQKPPPSKSKEAAPAEPPAAEEAAPAEPPAAKPSKKTRASRSRSKKTTEDSDS